VVRGSERTMDVYEGTEISVGIRSMRVLMGCPAQNVGKDVKGFSVRIQVVLHRFHGLWMGCRRDGNPLPKRASKGRLGGVPSQ
jgi:hypothetical protein